MQATCSQCRQSYITLLADVDQARVIDVVEDRTTEAAEQLWQALTPEQKQAVEAVAVDMWEPFIKTIEKEVPDADIVHDKYHVSSYLGKAVDQVRRQGHKELLAPPAAACRPAPPRAEPGRQSIGPTGGC